MLLLFLLFFHDLFHAIYETVFLAMMIDAFTAFTVTLAIGLRADTVLFVTTAHCDPLLVIIIPQQYR